MPPSTRRLRAVPVIGSALVLLLAAIGYLVFGGTRHESLPPAPPPPPGCQAGLGGAAIPLDTGQAGIAATIAGIAVRHRLPKRAVTIALAAALQESQLQNLDYGDRDSVGVFQQRPSQGWGTTAELEDPVYATTKFFGALVKVPGYTTMPVDQAAQDVQHSADGYAYEQWVGIATQLTGYLTGTSPGAVSCWYTPAGKADLAGALKQLTQTFGPAGKDAVLAGVTTDRSGKKNKEETVVHVQQGRAWTVAAWLVAHAQQYGISRIRYAGYGWNAANGSMGWQRVSRTASPVPRGSIVAA
ncbi:MAG: hypothetical protein ACRDOA_04160 [Streptosporangiaceae bacterium]